MGSFWQYTKLPAFYLLRAFLLICTMGCPSEKNKVVLWGLPNILKSLIALTSIFSGLFLSQHQRQALPRRKRFARLIQVVVKQPFFWSSNISKILQMGERVATFALQFDFPSQWLWKFRKDYRMKRQCQKSNSTPSEIGATKCWRNPSRRKKRYLRNPRKERQKPVLEPTSD